jgi:glycosyltransferase involved in cell wall biosynthesis
VSTVIPSRNRPDLVGRAVRSALDQTHRSVEVIVVIDGPDEATEQELARIGDPRLRVVSLAESVGAQEARNVGVRESSGPWVAFLDDDDEWLPEKLERQLEAARASGRPHPMVSCRLIARTAAGEFVSPRREPAPAETVGDYLFLRTQAEAREIRLQTSTLLATKELLSRVPWRKCAHDEWDLLLRASGEEGFGLACVAEPLAIWHSDAGRERLSYQFDSWRRSAEWFHSVRSVVGPRAYSSYLLSQYSRWARRAGDWKACLDIPWEAIRFGRPTLYGLAAHAGRWVLPQDLRRSLGSALLRRRTDVDGRRSG